MSFPKTIKFRYLFLPISWLYAFIIFVRNKLFDWKILETLDYDIPIICVGNLSLGGTGKTPHTEYLIRLLKNKYRIALLSRGYMRKSKGFVLPDESSTVRDIGDEVYQIKSKFSSVIIAVDGNRRRAIKNLLALDKPPELIIMDDGFQHRYVKPSYVILLSNYNRPIYKDKLFPVGMLRDRAYYLLKANDVIVSKCPDNLKPLDYRLMSNEVNLLPYQNLYFSSFKYFSLNAVFSKSVENRTLEFNKLKNKTIVLLTAIASTKDLISELSKYSNSIESIRFKDHHNFTPNDIKYINKRFDELYTANSIIIITEKDSSKLKYEEGLSDRVKSCMYSIEIRVGFSNKKDENKFNQNILDHVEKNKRNC